MIILKNKSFLVSIGYRSPDEWFDLKLTDKLGGEITPNLYNPSLSNVFNPDVDDEDDVSTAIIDLDDEFHKEVSVEDFANVNVVKITCDIIYAPGANKNTPGVIEFSDPKLTDILDKDFKQVSSSNESLELEQLSESLLIDWILELRNNGYSSSFVLGYDNLNASSAEFSKKEAIDGHQEVFFDSQSQADAFEYGLKTALSDDSLYIFDGKEKLAYNQTLTVQKSKNKP